MTTRWNFILKLKQCELFFNYIFIYTGCTKMIWSGCKLGDFILKWNMSITWDLWIHHRCCYIITLVEIKWIRELKVLFYLLFNNITQWRYEWLCWILKLIFIFKKLYNNIVHCVPLWVRLHWILLLNIEICSFRDPYHFFFCETFSHKQKNSTFISKI